MKMISSGLVAISLIASTAFADQNCTDPTLFPTTAAHCQCIMDNAVNDCIVNSPIKAVCNPSKLSSYFKENPAAAEAQCEKYRDKGTPDECISSVQFYDQNC